ncbi:MAG: hypothetical protein EOP04_11505 [Proteobacteria bacterium]|nr:MAG: hypothetical protein EOP04_11505 [Pseudomonadota bacterium]
MHLWQEAPMEAAHNTALDDLIKDVTERGCAVIEVRILLRWYERKNWGKSIWKDLQRRFDAILQERGEGNDGYRLFAIPSDSVISLLCFNREEDNNQWWSPVSELT